MKRRGMGAGAPVATSYTGAQITQMVASAAAQYGVPSQLAVEVAIQESGLNANAVSSAGAIGVMQLMPATAASLGVTNPYDPTQNIPAGVKYLASMYSEFGAWDQALGAYNWGPGNVQTAVAQYGSGWLNYAPAETQNYVTSIMSAANMSYSTSLTADSVTDGISNAASGAVATVQNAVSSLSLDPTTLLYLTGGAIALYLLLDFFGDDD